MVFIFNYHLEMITPGKANKDDVEKLIYDEIKKYEFHSPLPSLYFIKVKDQELREKFSRHITGIALMLKDTKIAELQFIISKARTTNTYYQFLPEAERQSIKRLFK